MAKYTKITQLHLDEYTRIAKKICSPQSFKGVIATQVEEDLVSILWEADKKVPLDRSRLEYLYYIGKKYAYENLYTKKVSYPILKEPAGPEKEYFEIEDLLGVLSPTERFIVKDKVFHNKRLRKIAKENKLSYYLVRRKYENAILKLRNYYANNL